jgi:hypothetical protein
MVTCLILFMGIKTNNNILIYLGLGAAFLLSLSLWSYFDPVVGRISFKVRSPILRGRLVIGSQAILSGAVSLFVTFCVFSFVRDITLGYLQR